MLGCISCLSGNFLISLSVYTYLLSQFAIVFIWSKTISKWPKLSKVIKNWSKCKSKLIKKWLKVVESGQHWQTLLVLLTLFWSVLFRSEPGLLISDIRMRVFGVVIFCGSVVRGDIFCDGVSLCCLGNHFWWCFHVLFLYGIGPQFEYFLPSN